MTSTSAAPATARRERYKKREDSESQQHSPTAISRATANDQQQSPHRQSAAEQYREIVLPVIRLKPRSMRPHRGHGNVRGHHGVGSAPICWRGYTGGLRR